jgi:hypothetical protein
VVASALVATSSCSLLSDFDNVAGVRPDDAGTDTFVEPEAGEAGEASAPFSCAGGGKLVCSTFDEGAVDKGGWTIEITGNGTTSLDASQYTSPPASFHAKIGSAADKVKIGAIINQRVVTGPFKTLVYAFDMRLLSCTSEGSGGSVTLAALQPSTQLAFGLVLIDTNKVAFAQSRLLSGQFTATPLTVQPSREWTRFEMRISISTTAAHASVTANGVVAFDGDIDTGSPASSMPLNLGANATGPVKGCDVVYDNVAFSKE